MTQLTYHGTGERIDTWLTKQFPYSRNFFHHIIERRGVKIGKTDNVARKMENVKWEMGKVVKKSHKLKNGEVVLIDDVTRYLSSVILEEAPDIDIPIVLEKEDYLVINKPKGVLSHPNSVREVGQPSVVGFLYHRYKKLPSIGNFIRAGLIHRLDKETDGLMIIAKTEKGLAHFKKIFQEKSDNAGKFTNEKVTDGKEGTPQHCGEAGKLKKLYRATCYITKDGKKILDEIQHQLPHYINELVIAKVPYYEPKMGITKIIGIEKIKKNDELIKLDIEILTGRTHQIRYHLSKHGLPIVGDYLYGHDEGVPMQLTAYKLIFPDLNGKIVELEI